jgi:hypothetical protein
MDFKFNEAKSDARNKVDKAKSVANLDANAHSERGAFSLLLRCDSTVSTSQTESHLAAGGFLL